MWKPEQLRAWKVGLGLEWKGRVGHVSTGKSLKEICTQGRKGWSSNWQEKVLFGDEETAAGLCVKGMSHESRVCGPRPTEP